MDRLSPLDAAFLFSEDGRSHNDIGMVLQFEGPAVSRSELIDAVAAQLPRLPRYRQKLRFIPMDAGLPVWIDDADFRLQRHVFEVPNVSAAPDALGLTVGRVMSSQMARDKPLWEIHLVRGLPEDGWALVVRMHHCMVDGVSSAEIVNALLSRSPEPTAPVPDQWRPAPEPSHAELLASAAADTARATVAGVGATASGMRSSMNALAKSAAAIDVPPPQYPPSLPITDPTFNGPVGPERRFAQLDVPLDDFKIVRSVLGGTINDVLLAVCASGFRALLRGRGEPVEGRVLRSMMPVSMRRSSGEAGDGGNDIGAMIVELPMGALPMAEQVANIRRQTEAFKRLKDAMPATELSSMPGFAPPALLTLASRLAATAPALAQTVTSNVPGPQVPLYLCGRPLRRLSACIALWAPLRIGVAMLSYHGVLSIGVVADSASVSDLPVFLNGLRHGVNELVDAAGGR